MVMPSDWQYFQHSQLRHGFGGKVRVRCPKPSCMFTFSGKTAFFKHLRTQHDNRADTVKAPQAVHEKVRCTHCHDDFDGIGPFMIHVKPVLEDWDDQSQGDITVKCPAPHCHNRKVVSWQAFRMHWSRHHKDTATQRQPRTSCEDLAAEDLAAEDLEACAVEYDSSAEDHHGDDDYAGSMDYDEDPTADPFLARVDKELSKLVAVLARVKSAHAVADLAIDKIYGAFADLNAASLDFWVSQATSTNPRHNVMNYIFEERLGATASKRQTVMKRDMDLLTRKELYLGTNENGDACHCGYMPLELVLARFFRDPSAVASFEKHKASVQKAWREGIDGYGEYFTTEAFDKMRSTLTEEENNVCEGVPLCIGMYRYNVYYGGYYINAGVRMYMYCCNLFSAMALMSRIRWHRILEIR